MADQPDDKPAAKRPRAATAEEPVDPRGRRVRDSAADLAKDVIGSGIGTLGGGVSKLGEGVSKLGDMSRGVPVVGSSVSKLGEGISHVGEQIHGLPQAARTRRGRLMIRSMIVGFVLVAAWIVVIVGLQLHGNDTPDFRPNAETILSELSKGSIDEVYDQSSPRFQEIVRKDHFLDDMTDLAQTVGKFREIASVNDTLVTSGPNGKVGRVSLTVAYEKATCKVSVSLHYHQGRWKMLGIGVELPPELKISQAQREARVKLCDDPMDIKHCGVHQAADDILHLLRDGHADQVWDEATPVFQKQEAKAVFVQLQAEHTAQLGAYRRILVVSGARVGIDGSTATFDGLAEFEKASGVRIAFAFSRVSKQAAWKLRSFKIVLPMPHGADETPPIPAGSDAPRTPPQDAGTDAR